MPTRCKHIFGKNLACVDKLTADCFNPGHRRRRNSLLLSHLRRLEVSICLAHRPSSPPFLNSDNAIDVDVLQYGHMAFSLADGRPLNADSVNSIAATRSEVQTRAEVALIAATAMDFVGLSQVTRHHFHAHSDGVAIGAFARQRRLAMEYPGELARG